MNKRIASVDILRGITIAAMILVNTPGTWDHVYAPLRHAEWHGLTPTDLVFPFFLFIVGISIYFAYKEKKASSKIYKKIMIRSLKLIGLGLFLNLFVPYIPFFQDLSTVRIPGVLQRIGIVFGIASFLYLHCNWKQLIAIGVSILIGYGFFMGYVPLPNDAAPTFDRSPNNWANYIDVLLLKNHIWQPDYDPEGILSTLPALVTTLIGILIGKLLDTKNDLLIICVTAIALLFIGYTIHFWFPINKAIWSSSFVLVTAGWATTILTIVYYFRDLKQIKFGTIFKYIGMNSIVIYFLSVCIAKSMYLIKVTPHDNVHGYLYETLFVHTFLPEEASSLIYALSVVFCYGVLAYILYRKRIFIKV